MSDESAQPSHANSEEMQVFETARLEQLNKLRLKIDQLKAISPSNLSTAFAKAQGEFRTPKLNRSAKVMKDGRLLYETHYADLEECIDCIRKPLSNNGLAFVHTTELRGNAWFLVLELMHASGESKETILPLNVNQTNQQLGGTLTYLKRYQMSAFFGLAADFDDDGNATETNTVEFDKTKGAGSKPAAKGNGSKPQTAVDAVADKGKAAQSALADDRARMEKEEIARAKVAGPNVVKKSSDPGEFIVSKTNNKSIDGKAIKDLSEKTLVNLYAWTQKTMQADPKPKNLGDLLNLSLNVKAFLNSMEVEV